MKDKGDRIFGVLFFVLFWGLLFSAFLIGQQWQQSRLEDQQPCTEDMSCWDCTSMGNQVCGTKP